MSSYKPPFARMRQIKRDAGPPLSREPQSVTEALAQMPAPPEVVFVVEEAEDEPEIVPEPVHIESIPEAELEAIILEGMAAEDEGTEPDPEPEPEPEVTPEPEVIPEPEPEPEPALDPEPAPKAKALQYDKLKRQDLIVLAANRGVAIKEGASKGQIIKALKAVER